MNRHSAPDTRPWSCLVVVGSILTATSFVILFFLWVGAALQ